MSKIKISSITLLVLFGITTVFLNIIPTWLGLIMAIVGICMFILLNIEAFKIKGLIKTLVMWADITIGLSIVSGILNTNVETSLFFITHQLINVFLLIFVGLIIAILVNLYKK